MDHRADDLILLSRRIVGLGAIVFRFHGGEVLRPASWSPGTDFVQYLVRIESVVGTIGVLVFTGFGLIK